MMIGVVIPAHSQPASLKRAIESLETERVVVVDDSPKGLDPIEGVAVVRTSGEEGFASAANPAPPASQGSRWPPKARTSPW